MTNCNMQMATQMQNLSNQAMMQSQNMILQQQLLNVNTVNNHTRGMVHPPSYMPPFSHGFNVNQSQMFYQRPVYNPQVFYHRPFTMNPQMYVPVQRPAHIHPPIHIQQQPVYGYPPSYVQHPQQHSEMQRQASVGPAQTLSASRVNIAQDSTPEMEYQQIGSLVSEIHPQPPNKDPSYSITSPNKPPVQQDSVNVCSESVIEVELASEMGTSQRTMIPDYVANKQPQTDQNMLSDTDKESSSQPQHDACMNQGDCEEKGSSSFLCVPGRKHIPPDNQVLLDVGKLITRQ